MYVSEEVMCTPARLQRLHYARGVVKNRENPVCVDFKEGILSSK